MYAPVIVFTYNRADKAELVLKALDQNTLAKDSDLYIFNDASNPEKENDDHKVEAVRALLKTYQLSSSFKNVHLILADCHKGLASSVISGVSSIMDQYGKVIVTEDDLISHVNYLQYMNDCLDYYEKNPEIWSISGYTFPMKSTEGRTNVFFTYRGSSWGWATWKDRWDTVDWSMKDYNTLLLRPARLHKLNEAGRDLPVMLRNQKKGVIDSWAVRWCFEEARHGLMTVYPSKRLVYNIGMDGSGSHGVDDGNDAKESLEAVPYNLIDPVREPEILNEFAYHYRDPWFHTVQKYH